MFGNLGLHVIRNPRGTYSYVGTIPTDLAEIVPADTPAVMGGRAFRAESGDLCMYRFPVFATLEAAVDFALERGHVVSR